MFANIKSTKVIQCIFALAQTILKLLTFQICDVQKVYQGHEEHLSDAIR